jgi:hypothetical protein
MSHLNLGEFISYISQHNEIFLFDILLITRTQEDQDEDSEVKTP